MKTILFHPKMETAIIEGRKCVTTRSTIKGKPGDILNIKGFAYRIVDIRIHPLEYIARNYYALEGCNSPDEFREIWMETHRGEWYPKDSKYVHFLAAVQNQDYYEVD